MKRLYIDGMALIDPRLSGIGSTLLNLIRSLESSNDFTSEYEIRLIVPFDKIGALNRWSFGPKVKISKNYIPGKIMNGLTKFGIMPPMDIFFGKGTYLFPNFRNWPLISSASVTYIHDVSFMAHPEFIEPRNLKLLKRFVPLWVRRADKVVTVSKHAESEIEKYYPESKGKVEVVPNGIDHSLYFPRPEAEVSQLLARYNIQKPYFIYLSNIEPRKNVDGLLDSFISYQADHEDTSLVLIGGMGWLNEDIKSRIAELKGKGLRIIRPQSYVPDEHLPGLLSGAIALVHPAFYEGFGISPLQAMACGTPVIVADNTSISEVVGKAGTYIDEKDPATITKAMKRVASEVPYAKELQEKGIDQAKKFSWNKSAQKLAVVIGKA